MQTEAPRPDRVTVRMPPEMLERAQELAKKEKRTISNWLKKLIEEAIENERPM